MKTFIERISKALSALALICVIVVNPGCGGGGGGGSTPAGGGGNSGGGSGSPVTTTPPTTGTGPTLPLINEEQFVSQKLPKMQQGDRAYASDFVPNQSNVPTDTAGLNEWSSYGDQLNPDFLAEMYDVKTYIAATGVGRVAGRSASGSVIHNGYEVSGGFYTAWAAEQWLGRAKSNTRVTYNGAPPSAMNQILAFIYGSSYAIDMGGMEQSFENGKLVYNKANGKYFSYPWSGIALPADCDLVGAIPRGTRITLNKTIQLLSMPFRFDPTAYTRYSVNAGTTITVNLGPKCDRGEALYDISYPGGTGWAFKKDLYSYGSTIGFSMSFDTGYGSSSGYVQSFPKTIYIEREYGSISAPTSRNFDNGDAEVDTLGKAQGRSRVFKFIAPRSAFYIMYLGAVVGVSDVVSMPDNADNDGTYYVKQSYPDGAALMGRRSWAGKDLKTIPSDFSQAFYSGSEPLVIVVKGGNGAFCNTRAISSESQSFTGSNSFFNFGGMCFCTDEICMSSGAGKLVYAGIGRAAKEMYLSQGESVYISTYRIFSSTVQATEYMLTISSYDGVAVGAKIAASSAISDEEKFLRGLYRLGSQ